MSKQFQLGDVVWRAQHVFTKACSASEWGCHGPATVTAVITRATGRTYLLTWEGSDVEILDEQPGDNLYRSKSAAQAAANRHHNAELKAQMR